MRRIQNLKYILFGLFCLIFSLNNLAQDSSLPNILWITSEDNSPLLGCYGDEFATTPHLDRLATEGFLYTHAFANYPVCSPTRNTIITGAYAASNGNEQMRSAYPLPESVIPYPILLRKAGYYCTNNVKTDYNFEGDYNSMWDDCSNTAHYKNRPEGKPFFAIFNLMTTHESQIFGDVPYDDLRHKPENVVLPPYHPDTKEMRSDWAKYYDKMEDMDARVGALLNELDESGEADNTIVFYYSDHGGVLARSKRYLFDSGTRVPFIVRIPEKYNDLYPAIGPGVAIDRLISFVDLPPTLLSLIDHGKPSFLQGSAFLGHHIEPEPDYVFMNRGRMDERIDMSRSVRDKKYRYTRNYMPFRIYLQHLAYLFNAQSAQSWENRFLAGECNSVQSLAFQTKSVEELYDTETDPHEVNNLAADPAYQEILERMRNANREWMKEIRDVGLIPETQYLERSGDSSLYAYMRSDDCPFEKLLEAAELATSARSGNIEQYLENLKNTDPAIRYWGATGLLIHKESAATAIQAIKQAAVEKESSTATLIAEILFHLGESEAANQIYLRILTSDEYNLPDRNFALNSLDAIDFRTPEIEAAVQNCYENNVDNMVGFAKYDIYDGLMSEYLIRKWKLNE